MKKFLGVITGVLIILIICLSIFIYMTSPVSNSKENIALTVNETDTYSSLGKTLYEKKLIRSELIYKIYIKFFLSNTHLEKGEYTLNQSMSLEDIIEKLKKGNNYNPETVKITFKEGLNARQIAKVISQNTNNNYEDVIRLLEDKTFAKKMIDEYWFLTDEILKAKIYYPLEGYLFPDTYEFLNKDVKTEQIIKTLLNEFGKKIEPYKEQIEQNRFNLNELITLASIAELESLPGTDRKLVVGVFVNRINNNIMTYQNLAYELEKVQCETPDNYQKISELKDKMRVLADSSGLTKSQLDLADTNGKAKYHTEVEDNKAKGEYAQYRINYEKELEKNVMTEIRDFAISKLKEEGAFDEEYEFKNGDVYSKPMDKNAMISKKMDELMKMADMSPIERGLYDLKRLGLISNDATALDLSSKQLEEIKNNYSDDAFRFVESYKTWKNRENMKPQANAIYKEYIQYKASLKDKKNGLSFSEYAKQIHNVEGLSDTMINEELIAEMREQSRGMTR